MKVVTTALLIALVVVSPTAHADGGDARRGQRVYEARCIACHSLDVNRVGPKHSGVFGRRAGTVEGYSYSKAVKQSGVVWNHATLDTWLANPGQFIPGSKMGFRLSRPQDRADVIAYLKRNSSVRD